MKEDYPSSFVLFLTLMWNVVSHHARGCTDGFITFFIGTPVGPHAVCPCMNAKAVLCQIISRQFTLKGNGETAWALVIIGFIRTATFSSFKQCEVEFITDVSIPKIPRVQLIFILS